MLNVTTHTGKLSRKEAEWAIDGGPYSRNILMGDKVMLQYDWSGQLQLKATQLKLKGTMMYDDKQATKGFSIRCEVSDNGNNWQIIGMLKGPGARYTITKNDTMVVASEVGVMDFDPTEIAEKGRLQPGKILLIDTQEGKIYYDGEIKKQLADEHPYRQWLSTNRIQLEKLKSGRHVENGVSNLLQKEMMLLAVWNMMACAD